MNFKEIREKRVLLGLTQTDVAVFVGVSLTAFQNWERGVSKPTQGHLEKLKQALKMK